MGEGGRREPRGREDTPARAAMQNDKGENVDLYIPRKCSWTNRIIGCKDHSSIQINIAHLDENGVVTSGRPPSPSLGRSARRGSRTACWTSSGTRPALRSGSKRVRGDGPRLGGRAEGAPQRVVPGRRSRTSSWALREPAPGACVVYYHEEIS